MRAIEAKSFSGYAGCGRPDFPSRNRRVADRAADPAQLARSVPVIDRELPSTLLQTSPRRGACGAGGGRRECADRRRRGGCVAPRFSH